MTPRQWRAFAEDLKSNFIIAWGLSILFMLLGWWPSIILTWVLTGAYTIYDYAKAKGIE